MVNLSSGGQLYLASKELSHCVWEVRSQDSYPGCHFSFPIYSTLLCFSPNCRSLHLLGLLSQTWFWSSGSQGCLMPAAWAPLGLFQKWNQWPTDPDLLNGNWRKTWHVFLSALQLALIPGNPLWSYLLEQCLTVREMCLLWTEMCVKYIRCQDSMRMLYSSLIMESVLCLRLK